VIQLQIRKDNEFVWTATTSQASPRIIAGRYYVEGDTLYLSGGSGTLVGHAQNRNGGAFSFSLLGNSGAEPGLEFVPTSGR
jgi:hypothetical protein